MVPTREQLRGLSYEKASLYGMPHIGCKYRTRYEIASTAFEGRTRKCACCGRVGGVHSRHHEPPRANGHYMLATGHGTFQLRPALIDLCGSGTMGCHGDRHNGRLSIRWEWDSEENEKNWWNGYMLSLPGHEPHGKWLYAYGHYVFDHDGKTWQHRGECE